MATVESLLHLVGPLPSAGASCLGSGRCGGEGGPCPPLDRCTGSPHSPAQFPSSVQISPERLGDSPSSSGRESSPAQTTDTTWDGDQPLAPGVAQQGGALALPTQTQGQRLDDGELEGPHAKQSLEDRLEDAHGRAGQPAEGTGTSCASDAPAPTLSAQEAEEELLRENPSRFTLFPVR
jgi:hypothetical protein